MYRKTLKGSFTYIINSRTRLERYPDLWSGYWITAETVFFIQSNRILGVSDSNSSQSKMTSQKQKLPPLPQFCLFCRLCFTAPVFCELNWSWRNRRREYKLLKTTWKRLNHTPTFLTSLQRAREALLVSFDKKYLKMQISFEVSMQNTPTKRTCSSSYFWLPSERTQRNEIDTNISSFALTWIVHSPSQENW